VLARPARPHRLAVSVNCWPRCHTVPVSTPDKVWQPPPGWPEPPQGWTPPEGWAPSPEWPAAPPGWQFWKPADAPPAPTLSPSARRDLVLETWFIQLAFLAPGVLSAVDLLVSHSGGATISRFPDYDPNPAVNLILGIASYLAVAATVPIALLLLSRTGQPPSALGLGRPWWRADVWPGLGLALGCYGATIVATLVLTGVVGRNSKLLVQVPVGNVPHYYIIYGIAISAVTAVAEETLVSGYLLTRLEQLGWSRRRALTLSLILRTSYHVYYGLGFLLTVPFGYLVTRSFQKRRRLLRPIIAHFVYDGVLITLAILITH
jgi:membrane protease YdiL (CAAX protease family)